MKSFSFIIPFLVALFMAMPTFSQGTLPIYGDYLSDNVYLVHPAAAGIGNTSKLRFTARQQWAGIPNAPALQTLSFHSRLGEESNAAYGFVMFNDKNGYHAQQGMQGTYAYHLPMSIGRNFEQLSFGLSFTFVQNQSDQRLFSGDPSVSQIIQSSSYYNSDFGMSYHLGGFSSYLTIKNLLLTAKNNFNINEPLDLRNYIVSVGYFYGTENVVQLEPSIMLQFRESTGERIADFNLKVYKTFGETQFWATVSYRRNFDSGAIENLQYITPIIGLNFKRFMFSYTYSHQLNDLVYTNSGFNQVSLGFNLFTRAPRAAACPNINAMFNGF
ncbi:type IX secretion system membrane protein PorP/SprF [Polaribacter sp. HL-MS24]|uniref:PorP/SprF family type IX secretion system membrane protein n=1 Tax=Polaribacter sp. HL-MS24 TaxID=3077735 RepID=UPI002934FE7F|nr:type IX secretion system membrane protein PorP/SprF [Polaribacter sp. HL-MS24]WOC39445.1 type IX secretion system membrane protein PorP/SprF [Polaribacter sp. HL-MS24]